jgi:glycosyltransferase involved in cell wall biosynthesis
MQILFFTPYGGLSGSEMMLSYLLLQLSKNGHGVSLFSREPGELLKRISDVIPVYTFEPSRTRWERWMERAAGRPRGTDSSEHFITRLHANSKPDLWYINTLAMPEVARLAIKLNVPYILHVHEMPMVYSTLAKAELQNALAGASLVIACSQAVLDCLKVMGVGKIELQYECVDLSQVRAASEKAQSLRRGLRIDDRAFVWGMSGLVEYRKGADLFLEAAKFFRDENVHFLWLGPPGQSGYQLFIERSVAYYDLNNVHFVGKQTSDYYDYLNSLDGFVLTSREDPFPLVMIEAAALGKPVVAFDSGGVREFVQDGMGTVIDSWNVADLVEAMRAVMNKQIPIDRDILENRAREFDVSIQVQHLEVLLRRHFAPQQPSTSV